MNADTNHTCDIRPAYWRLVCHTCGFKYPPMAAGAACCPAPRHHKHCLHHPCKQCEPDPMEPRFHSIVEREDHARSSIVMSLAEQTRRVLSTLTPREMEVLRTWVHVPEAQPKREAILHLPLKEIPQAISDSVRAVLKAHGYAVLRNPTQEEQDTWPLGVSIEHVPLDPAEHDSLLRKIGNNAAAALQGLDANPENE